MHKKSGRFAWQLANGYIIDFTTPSNLNAIKKNTFKGTIFGFLGSKAIQNTAEMPNHHYSYSSDPRLGGIHKRQRRKRQSVTAKREKSQAP